MVLGGIPSHKMKQQPVMVSLAAETVVLAHNREGRQALVVAGEEAILQQMAQVLAAHRIKVVAAGARAAEPLAGMLLVQGGQVAGLPAGTEPAERQGLLRQL